MTIETVRNVLLWSTIIHWVLVVVWALVYRYRRGWVHSVWRRWFPLSPEQFDTLGFAVIGIYEVGILLFNMIPLIALYLAAP